MSDLCPCCMKQEAVPGLFEKVPEAAMPSALLGLDGEPAEFASLGAEDPLFLYEGYGRYFIPVEMPLPLHRKDTPTGSIVWAEISAQAAEAMRDVVAGERKSFSGAASLASDIPGFPGTVGAAIRLRYRAGDSFPLVMDCVDQRILSIDPDLDHEGMAALYRTLWGNPDPLPRARHTLREEVRSSLREQVSARSYTRLVIPPPQIAGIDPGEVLVAPPLDTGEPASMYTVGCSDVTDGTGTAYEIASFLRNPSDDLVHCFGEFVYLSRMNPNSRLPGQIVPERHSIPDSRGRMIAWMLLYPWDSSLPETGSVEYIRAIPLLGQEVAFAAAHGPDRLEEELRNCSEDLTSLDRRPCAEPYG